MSDFEDLMESMGLNPGCPDSLEKFINSIESEPNEIFTPDGNIPLDDIIVINEGQCDDPDECADCDGECEWECSG